jgi:chromosome segregation ATPase
MEEIALAQINSFPSPAPQVDFIQALLGELQALREEVARLQEDNQDIRATVTAQAEEIVSLKENWKEARPATTATRLDDLWSWVEEIDSKINSQPEEPTPISTRTFDHIDQLARVMTEDKRRSVSVATAAKLLGLSKERMRQLKPLLLADSRFELGWDRQRGQRKRVVIRLNQFIK